MRVVAQCEIDDWCRAVLRKHWPGVRQFSDVRELRAQDVADLGIDLVCGGYPCQPESSAGLRLSERDPRFLWPEVARLLAELRPTWFVGENVRGHVSRGLDRVLGELEALGYTARPFLVSAQGVGAPHKRERVFVVAHTDGLRESGASGPRIEVGDGARLCRPAVGDAEHGGRQGRLQKRRWPDAALPPSEAVSDARRAGLQTPQQPGEPAQSILGPEEQWAAAAEHHWWATEPAVGRMAHGVPRRVDRLKGLGNAVVPAQAFPVFAQIAYVEGLTSRMRHE